MRLFNICAPLAVLLSPLCVLGSLYDEMTSVSVSFARRPISKDVSQRPRSQTFGNLGDGVQLGPASAGKIAASSPQPSIPRMARAYSSDAAYSFTGTIDISLFQSPNSGSRIINPADTGLIKDFTPIRTDDKDSSHGEGDPVYRKDTGEISSSPPPGARAFSPRSPFFPVTSFSSWLNFSPAVFSLSTHVSRAEDALGPSLIDAILRFDFVPFVESTHGAALELIRDSVLTAMAACEGAECEAGVVEGFGSSQKVINFRRMVYEVIVEVANAKTQSHELLEKAFPFVHTLRSVEATLGFDTNEFNQIHAPLIQKILSHAPPPPPSTPERARSRSFSAVLPEVARKRELKMDDFRRFVTAIADFLDLNLETKLHAATSSSRREDNDNDDDDSNEGSFVAHDFDAPLDVVEFKRNLWLVTRCLELVARKSSKVRSDFEKERKPFCLHQSPRILDYLTPRRGHTVSPADTRLAVDFVFACKDQISLEDRFYWSLPRMMQSGVHQLPEFLDVDVLFEVPQDDGMVPALLNRMVTFTKLELMNHVYVRFEDSEAQGIEGLRRSWLSRSIAELARVDPSDPFSLFRFIDDHRAYIKPVSVLDVTPQHMQLYRVFGRLLGLAIRYDVTAGIHLAPSCIDIILHTHDGVKHSQRQIDAFLREEDPEWTRGIESVSEIPDSSESEFESTPLDHTETDLKSWIKTEKKMRIHDSVLPQMRQIASGIFETIRRPLVEALFLDELVWMINGARTVDVKDLTEGSSWIHLDSRRRAESAGPVVLPEHVGRSKIKARMKNSNVPLAVRYLFLWLSEASNETRELFLMFVSGSRYTPIGGFVKRKNNAGEERGWLEVTVDPTLSTQFLPTTHTCFVDLMIPPYTSVEQVAHRFSVVFEAAQFIDS